MGKAVGLAKKGANTCVVYETEEAAKDVNKVGTFGLLGLEKGS